MTPLLFFVGDGLVLLPVLLEVLSLDDEDVEDDVMDVEDDDFDDVLCGLAVVNVEFVVEFFAMLPVPIVELVREPVVVELPEEPAAPVELLLVLGPGATTGVLTPLFEPEDVVEEGEEPVAFFIFFWVGE